MMKKVVFLCSMIIACIACEKIEEVNSDKTESINASPLSLCEVAQMLSNVEIKKEQVKEVFNAVNSSSKNGYDEEYTMKDLFKVPGKGVGDNIKTKSFATYSQPLSTLIENYLKRQKLTKSTQFGGLSAEDYIKMLSSSDIQIYWPYYEQWDGKTLPIITFDPQKKIIPGLPLNIKESNIGYLLEKLQDGTQIIKEIEVTEEIAKQRPVWVINRNDDSAYSSIEVLRKNNPDWGKGGSISVKSGEDSTEPLKSLLIKDITVMRNYDSWFRGASEFFIKCGSVENFRASTEAEMQLYNPSITDFMVVVKRKQIGQTIPFNVVLVSDWSEQLESCAFLVTEDDGGTKTSWKCNAMVKYNSKSYGFEMEIPYCSKDDIVWRGKLSRRYLDRYSNYMGNFGDMKITFQVVQK